MRPQVGPYRILDELARGGHGTVYRAQGPDGAQVALKVLHAERTRDSGARQRFLREAQALQRLDHPNVVAILGTGDEDGTPWLALEFVLGETLNQRLEAGPLEVRRAIELARQVGDALAHAHAQGILHRDLKPDNVLLRGGQALLTDFGLALDQEGARLTQTGVFLGTPGYWAPEQAQGQTHQIGPATDVYGLGALLYACLTGRPPIVAESFVDYLRTSRVEQIQPPHLERPEVPLWLSRLCMRCLSPDPHARPQAVRAVVDALAEGRDLGGRLRRSRPGAVLLALAVSAALLGVTSLGVLVWARGVDQTAPPPPSTPEATPPPSSPERDADADAPGPHPLDLGMGRLQRVRPFDLGKLPWDERLTGTREELLAGRRAGQVGRVFRALREARPRVALAMLYQVATAGAQLEDDPRARMVSQGAWVFLSGALFKQELRGLVWTEEEWERLGQELVLECLRRAAAEGRSDAPLFEGQLYHNGTPPFPCDLAAAARAYQATLDAEHVIGEWDLNNAKLGLARVFGEAPDTPGAPDLWTALAYAEHGTGVFREDERKQRRAVELRDRFREQARERAQGELDRALGALPEVTLADLADYEPKGVIFPDATTLLSLRNANGLDDAYTWLRRRGEHAKAAALLYQVAQRGQGLAPGLERVTTQRGWFLLARALRDRSSGLRPLLWSDSAWAQVGWDVISQCYARAYAGGRSDGAVHLAHLYRSEATEFGREPDLVRAQAWYRKVLELERADDVDRDLAHLHLAGIAYDHPELPGRVDDEEALRLVRYVLSGAPEGSYRQQEARRVEAGLLARIEGR